MASFLSQVGEAYVGTGLEAAHLNTVLGVKGGPVETAWATALATPREGHVGFVVIARPNFPVQPMTLFVNKATIASPAHGNITWGAAQLGVASGVLDAVAGGDVDAERLHELLLIAAVWVDPGALDADAVYENNRAATAQALRNGATYPNAAAIEELLALRDVPTNGYYTPRSLP